MERGFSSVSATTQEIFFSQCIYGWIEDRTWERGLDLQNFSVKKPLLRLAKPLLRQTSTYGI